MRVEILYAHDCGHCVRAAERVVTMAHEWPSIEALKVDITDTPETALAHGYETCPLLVVDGKVAYVGVPTHAFLADLASHATAP
ncbi:MAG TPA: thioredoxin family protein [Candidatus Thermoplasmatota archaeon]|nr:thioredoxin family protein [Candidatus Thermoplasmatota archaeon]